MISILETDTDQKWTSPTARFIYIQQRPKFQFTSMAPIINAKIYKYVHICHLIMRIHFTFKVVKCVATQFMLE